VVTRLTVSDILDNISQGERASEIQLEKVGEAAAALRDEFLKDAFQAAGTLTPRTNDFEAFKNCLKTITDLLMKHGFVTASEVHLIWMRVEEVER
jgi:hypothetical protein